MVKSRLQRQSQSLKNSSPNRDQNSLPAKIFNNAQLTRNLTRVLYQDHEDASVIQLKEHQNMIVPRLALEENLPTDLKRETSDLVVVEKANQVKNRTSAESFKMKRWVERDQLTEARNRTRAFEQATDFNSAVMNNHTAMDFTQDGINMNNSDSQSLKSEDFDSDESRVNAKGRKSFLGIGCYGCLKIVNLGLYLATLLLAFAYFGSTKYEHDLVYYAFYGIICARPAIIGLYTLISLGLLACRRDRSKAERTSESDSESDASSVNRADDQSRVQGYEMNDSFFRKNQIRNQIEQLQRSAVADPTKFAQSQTRVLPDDN